jgi:hypothetical protein
VPYPRAALPCHRLAAEFRRASLPGRGGCRPPERADDVLGAPVRRHDDVAVGQAACYHGSLTGPPCPSSAYKPEHWATNPFVK